MGELCKQMCQNVFSTCVMTKVLLPVSIDVKLDQPTKRCGIKGARDRTSAVRQPQPSIVTQNCWSQLPKDYIYSTHEARMLQLAQNYTYTRRTAILQGARNANETGLPDVEALELSGYMP